MDIVKGWAATVALFLAYSTVPLIGVIGGVFTPFPALYFGLKSGRSCGVAIVALSAVVMSLAMGPSYGALYLFQCGVVSIVLPEFLGRGNGAARSIGSTVAINAVMVALFAVVYAIVQGVDINALVLKGIKSGISQTAQIYEKSGLKGDDLKLFQDALKDMGGIIARIYPSLLIIAMGLVTGLNAVLLKRVASRLPRPLEMGDFNRFKNPDHLVWALIAAGFTMLADNPLVTQGALNVLIIVIPLYFFQGMAVLLTFFDRYGAPRFMRYLFYLMLAFTQFLAIVVAVLGIFDLWGDFRTPKQQENL